METKKIETSVDIENWAKEVVQGNGTIFTPLSKQEQFRIASYICDKVESNKPLLDALRPENDVPLDALIPENESPKDDPIPVENEVHGETDTKFIKPCPCDEEENQEQGGLSIIDNADWAESNKAEELPSFEETWKGLNAQKVFDEFLNFCRKTKTPTQVMDFSTGKQSVAAVFAYWLFTNYMHKMRHN